MTLSVIVPAWNEAHRIGRCVEAWAARGPLELVVVDDGSTDRTAEFARQAAPAGLDLKVVSIAHQGKGAATRAGMLASRGARALLCDCDLSADLDDLPRLEAALDAGADVAVGSRETTGAARVRSQPLHRRALGRAFSFAMRALRLSALEDTQCGFKLFTRAAAHRLFAESKVDGYAFDVEILWLARRAGLCVVEVPIRWRDDTDSRVRPVADGVAMLTDALRVRRLHRR